MNEMHTNTEAKIGAVTYPNQIIGFGDVKNKPYDNFDKGLKISEIFTGAFEGVLLFLKLAADVAVSSTLLQIPLIGFLGLVATRFLYRTFREPTVVDAFKGKAALAAKN